MTNSYGIMTGKVSSQSRVCIMSPGTGFNLEGRLLHPPLLILPVRLGRNYGLIGCLLRLRLGFGGLDWISSRHVSISTERGFKTDMVCVLCGAYGESTNHLMWDCIFKMYDIPRTSQSSSVLDCSALWAVELNQSNFEICLMVMWAIWNARNDRNDVVTPPDLVTTRCLCWWQEFNRVAFTPTQRTGAHSQLHFHWSRPSASSRLMLMAHGMNNSNRGELGVLSGMIRALLWQLLRKSLNMCTLLFRLRRWLPEMASCWQHIGVFKILL